MNDKKLVQWVLSKCDEWREWRDDNYEERWKEYERLWRGYWSSEDRERQSERSRIISPALQQAIENHVAEVEEAVFGSGDYLFDIEDDMRDENPQDVEYLKAYMKECFKKTKLRKAVDDCLLNAAIYGTGIGELHVVQSTEFAPATQPIPETGMLAVGVTEQDKVNVILKPIAPRNFIIDPNAASIDDAEGVAIEEFVSLYSVAEKIRAGSYRDVDVLGDSSPDDDLEIDSTEEHYDFDKVRVLRYYGKVPKELLEAIDSEEGEVELFTNTDEGETFLEKYGETVEAIIVIGNENALLKAEANPYMMQDRPVVAFQDDTVPGKFWGRGVAEKGYNMQKAIDGQLRSHMDSIALTTVPMMAMDATRLPRGSKFEVRPGKTILTNGNPNEILQAFKFGVTGAENIETANKLEQMLLQATGTLDNASVASQPEGGSMNISLSGLIKRNKRTLVNFQENFLIPFVEKAAWRFMQFDPEHFPVADWKFVPMSTLGMLAREVEQLQFINLMKTLGPDSPVMPILLQGVVANSSLSSKQQILAQIAQSNQPDPQQQQVQQMQMALEMRNAEATVAKTESEVKLNEARVINEIIDAQLKPEEVRAKVMSAMTTNLPNAEEEQERIFNRRVKVAELMLKEQDMDNNMKIVQEQMSKNT
jgi:bifunctional DNA-binding transcriptional regulator/antitoxin component of YhaV-PrlF toxin-antitoxin module